VTVVIGEKYLQEYKRLFKQSQKMYAKKHGYDFKVVKNFLDDTYKDNNMSFYFQKFLVCSQTWSTEYDYIIYVDADVLININSPPIHNYVDYENFIGIANEYSQPTNERRISIQRKMGWETSATDYYNLCDFNLQTDMVFNSGVLVFQPKIHGEYLQNIYNKHLPKSIHHSRGPHYEQTSLGYELQKDNKYKILDNKFNAIWGLVKLDNIENKSLKYYFKQNYFVHFAGHCDFDKVEKIHKKCNILNN